MSQIETMYSNIDKITAAVDDINKSVNVASPPSMDIREHFMTDRQVMKKVMMSGGNMSGIPDPSATDIQMSEEDAHSLVYGKLMYDDNGKLVDNEEKNPECVDKKTKVKDSHPLKMWIKNKKLDVAIAFDSLKSKSAEIGEASTQLSIETVAAFITIGSSAAILPFGAGVPTAFSALQGIFSALQAFQTKVIQVLPILEPLTYVAILIPLDVIGTVIGMINGLLAIVSGALAAVAGLLAPIAQLKSIIGTEPPKQQMKLEKIEANPETIGPGQSTKLSIFVTNGSWDYNYTWSHNGTVISNEKEVQVQPLTTTTYTCTAVDKDGSGALVSGQVTVIVI